MEDLANERDLVVDRLKSFNFEPVNAEGILPSGGKSWDRICEEIDSCHLFVLLLGERYGWIPPKGPLASQKISVTHGEYRRAREQQLPVLTFKKIIQSGKDHADDIKARQAFWDEVMEWDSGQFISDFHLARDLAEKVATSIVTMLPDEYQNTRIVERMGIVRLMTLNDSTKGMKDQARELQQDQARKLREDPIPLELIKSVQHRNGVLFAGSGISLAAGLPSAEAFAARLAAAVGRSSHPVVGSGLASLATDVEIDGGGRDYLDYVIRPLFELGGRASSPSHLQAVRYFDRIITTNYDDLFERAVYEANSGHKIIIAGGAYRTKKEDTDVISKITEGRYLLKLHGTYTQPRTLVISEYDLFEFQEKYKVYIDAARYELHNRTPIVVGSSLRDPTIFKLFHEVHRERGQHGYYISPEILPTTQVRIERFGLYPIRASVESFLNALEALQPRQT